MSEVALRSLQTAIIKNTDFDVNQLRNALSFNPDTITTFNTFDRALLKEKINPTMLLVLAANMAMEINYVYLRYVGLALRYNANPNVYMLASFVLLEDDEEQTFNIPVHIGKHIWDLTPRSINDSVNMDVQNYVEVTPNASVEELTFRMQDRQQVSLDLFAMLMIAGMEMDAQVTSVALLRENGVNATRFATLHPEFFISVYASVKLGDQPGPDFADELDYYKRWRTTLNSVYLSSDSQGTIRNDRIYKYALLMDRPEILTLPTVYSDREKLQQIFSFQCRTSLEIILQRLYELKLIGQNSPATRELELVLLNLAIDNYNFIAMKQLMKLDVVPPSTTRSKTIAAAKATCPVDVLACQYLNTMLVDYVKYGHGLDNEQINELSFSPSTQAAVRKQYATPTWKMTCRLPNQPINQDVKQIAREVGIPVGSDKATICETFKEMSKSNPATLKQATYDVNRTRIGLASIAATDIISGRRTLNDTRKLPALEDMSVDEIQRQADRELNEKPSAVKPSGIQKITPICANYDNLDRPIEDYPSIDRVTYVTNKQTWCFTSENFQLLIESGINPWATDSDGEIGAPIPDEVLLEMKEKLALLEKHGLLNQRVGSVARGIDSLFNTNPVNNQLLYENETKRNLEWFFQFVENYGVDRTEFEGLNSSEIQDIADNVLSTSTRIVVNEESAQLALRDLANATILEITNFSNQDEVGDLYNLTMIPRA